MRESNDVLTSSIPLKSSDEVDWVSPLSKYIGLNYGKIEDYAEECNLLHRLRQDVRGVGRDATGRDLLYKYYGQLELLDLRFPIDENHIRVPFIWKDAFTQKSVSQYSLAYEKACIIFNLAAVLSAIGANQNREDPEGIKKAFHAFQASAGLFYFINENFLHAPSDDLSRETVKTLADIMVAQSQEVATEKQITDQRKNSVVAKLAAQTSALYMAACESLSERLGYLHRSWMIVVQAKERYYHSVSCYYQALVDDEAARHGDAISRLNKAEAACKEASRYVQSMPFINTTSCFLPADAGTILTEVIKTNTARISEEKGVLQRDNDFIYHQTVPSDALLPVIGKMALAKPLPMSDIWSSQDVQKIVGPDIFVKILPISVHESASLYSEEKAQIIRTEQERCDVANEELASALQHLDLPNVLFELQKSFSSNKINQVTLDSFKSFGDKVRRLQNVQDWTMMAKDLEELRFSLIEKLTAVDSILNEDESECERMRLKFGMMWSQLPSSSIDYDLRDKVRTIRESIAKAAASDSDLKQQMEAGAVSVKLLIDPELRNIRQLMVGERSSENSSFSLLDIDDADNTSVDRSNEVNPILELLDKVSSLKRERLQIMRDLKIKARDDDISSIILLNRKSSDVEPQLFAAELEKFRPYQTRIASTYNHQKGLLGDIATMLKQLLQKVDVKDGLDIYHRQKVAQEDLLTRLQNGYDIYIQTRQGLE